jgi:N-acetylneuraminate synthase
MPNTYIIAEAGVNHNGSLVIAKKLIDAAKEAGADAVKFQTFKTEKTISKKAPKAEYQKSLTGDTESQFDMVKKLELDEKSHYELVDYAQKKGIKFLSTAFDVESVDLLIKLGIDVLKIPSGEVTNALLMHKIASKGLPIIISTGMCTLGDIEQALGVVAFGYLKMEHPAIENFRTAYFSKEGQKILKEKVTLLHCTTEYPAPLDEVNLNAMLTLKNAFDLPVGYSDHTNGINVSIGAAALGAVLIEKHFTLDKDMPGPDHQASLEPDELKAMVIGIREVEKALGTSQKLVSASERKNLDIARKSLTANNDIQQGDIFTEDNIIIMRPGSGISPMHYWELIGKKATKSYQKDDMIGFSEIYQGN